MPTKAELLAELKAMKSARAFIALVGVALMANPGALRAASTSTKPIKPGVYYCVTQRMVGIQGKTGKRYWGRIHPDAALRRFTVKISPVWPWPGFPKYTPSECRSTRFYRRSEFGHWTCDTKYQAQFSSDLHRLPNMRGMHPYDFAGEGGFSKFDLFDDRTFDLWFGDLGDDFYLAEGHCDSFK